jgi:hypothetical protein
LNKLSINGRVALLYDNRSQIFRWLGVFLGEIFRTSCRLNAQAKSHPCDSQPPGEFSRLPHIVLLSWSHIFSRNSILASLMDSAHPVSKASFVPNGHLS